MVVKNRSNSGDRFVLPLVNEYKEKEQMKTLIETVPLHLIGDDDTSTTFWRRWISTGQLSQVTNFKKHDTLPSWGNPQDDCFVVAQPKSQIVFTTRRKKADAWSFLTLCLIVIGAMTYWHLNSALRLIRSEIETVMAVRNQINIKLRSSEKDVRMLSREVSATSTVVQTKLQDLGEDHARELTKSYKLLTTAKLSRDSMKAQVESYKVQKKILKAAVQNQSRRNVEAKYGSGKTIQVEFTLEFPDGKGGPNTFKVEMASLDLMPNAVYTFLTMVEQGLWDGCSFVMKAIHLLKAAPLPYDQTRSPAETARVFVETNLNGPIFKEYNQAFPHTPYTLGFAGGDSPSFYINTEDNTDLHEGDSAFGKVVSGFDTLKRVDEAPKENGIWLRDRIGIKSTLVIVL